MANLFEPPRYIAVEGPIRVGKSTLCRVIAETLHAQRISEPEKIPSCALYQGETGAAFQAPVRVPHRPLRAAGRLEVKRNPNKTYVADYIFEKDKLFACLNLGDANSTSTIATMNCFARMSPRPTSSSTCRPHRGAEERLKKKGAPGEKTISDDYLEEVIKATSTFSFTTRRRIC